MFCTPRVLVKDVHTKPIRIQQNITSAGLKKEDAVSHVTAASGRTSSISSASSASTKHDEKPIEEDQAQSNERELHSSV
jgi:hypothetical protein